MCKLTKNLPIQGGCWIFRIQRGGFDKGKGKIPGVETPVGAMLHGHIPNLLFLKRKIVRLGSKMDHISANLALSRREKKIGGTKGSRGARSL